MLQTVVKKFNCTLHLGLYGIGCMRCTVAEDPEFERKLGQCSGLTEGCYLKKAQLSKQLLSQSCKNYIELIMSNF